MRTYTELITLPTIKERYEYLKLGGAVGVVTFGGDRTFNQNFYSSRMWKDVRRQIIIRDHGCDLGVEGYDINNRITIHHMNPVTRDDIRNEDWEYLTNPEYLISCSIFNASSYSLRRQYFVTKNAYRTYTKRYMSLEVIMWTIVFSTLLRSQ